MGQPFGKMHALRPRSSRQGLICADKQQEPAFTGYGAKTCALERGVGGSKGPEDDGGSPRQGSNDGLGVWRADRVGKEEEAWHGLSRAVAAP